MAALAGLVDGRTWYSEFTGQARRNLLFEQTGGLLAIETDVADVRVCLEKTVEVIGGQAGFRYR